VVPALGHFKQLCNKSQEQVLVAVAIRLTCWSRLWYSIFPTRSWFGILLFEANDLAACRLYDR